MGLPKSQRPILDRVLKDLFQGSPIGFNLTVGQTISDSRLVLGCAAGPDLNLFNLFHEMAHFVEIDTGRMLCYGWGLNFGKRFWIMGREYFEPSTWQATQRELRVAAIQYHISQRFGVRAGPVGLVSAFEYLNDFCYIPVCVDGLDYNAGKARRLAFLARECKKLIKSYSWDWFEREWRARCSMLSVGLISKAA